jgi:hypothetical protein
VTSDRVNLSVPPQPGAHLGTRAVAIAIPTLSSPLPDCFQAEELVLPLLERSVSEKPRFPLTQHTVCKSYLVDFHVGFYLGGCKLSSCHLAVSLFSVPFPAPQP